MPPSGDVAIVIPARNESDRIQATVKAAAGVPGADMLVVVDDGSADDTGFVAENAGAIVLRHGRTRGKGAAMETGAEAVGLLERSEDRAVPRHLLFLDADLAESAAYGAALVQPVRDGQADMTIAVFSERVRAGGHGFVVALSGSGIRRATGWLPAQPLNGQRCLTRAAFEAARPLAPGWGAETGMTIDLHRLGLRITEVEVPMAHRATGGDWRAQLHRARQFAGVARALAAREPAVQTGRGVGPAGAAPVPQLARQAGSGGPHVVRTGRWAGSGGLLGGVLGTAEGLLGLDAVLQQQSLQPVHLVAQPVEFAAQRRDVHPGRPLRDQAVPPGQQLLLALPRGRGPVEVLCVHGRVLGLPGQLDPGVVVPDAGRGDDVARRPPVLARPARGPDRGPWGTVSAEPVEHVPAHPVSLAHQAEQDVLGAHVQVAEVDGLPDRQLQDPLAPRRERDVPGLPCLPSPMMSRTCSRAASGLIPSTCRARPATPSRSRSSPSRRCSVPMKLWCSARASC